MTAPTPPSPQVTYLLSGAPDRYRGPVEPDAEEGIHRLAEGGRLYEPFPPDLRDALGVLRDVAGHCAVLVGYEIRPYDAGQDRRVWWWQRRGCWRTTAEGRAMVARLAAALANGGAGDTHD